MDNRRTVSFNLHFNCPRKLSYGYALNTIPFNAIFPYGDDEQPVTMLLSSIVPMKTIRQALNLDNRKPGNNMHQIKKKLNLHHIPH